MRRSRFLRAAGVGSNSRAGPYAPRTCVVGAHARPNASTSLPADVGLGVQWVDWHDPCFAQAVTWLELLRTTLTNDSQDGASWTGRVGVCLATSGPGGPHPWAVPATPQEGDHRWAIVVACGWDGTDRAEKTGCNMDNFVPLRDVLREVTHLLQATADHMMSVASSTDELATRASPGAESEREALLASTIATQRNELVEALSEYLLLVPEDVTSTWIQYTADTDSRRLLDDLLSTRTLTDAIRSLDRIDQAIVEVFEISRRQEHPEGAREACEWAARCIQSELERRALTVCTANDV